MGEYIAVRDGGKTNEEDAFRFLAQLTEVFGIIGPDDLQVTERGAGQNASVDVAVGDIFLEYSSYGYWGWNSLPKNVTISANATGNDRIDAIVAYHDQSVVDSTSSNNPGALVIEAVEGTPAGSPVAPSDSEIQTEIGAGYSFRRLANVNVANGFSTITNANITDTRVFHELKGTGTKFWNDLPDTATRVSNTQLTIPDVSNAGGYDALLCKGTVIKWEESGAFKIAAVTSVSYASDVVTINILGDHFGSGFSDVKYAINKCKVKEFAIAGILQAVSEPTRTWWPEHDMYGFFYDVRVKETGNGATTFDIEEDGNSKLASNHSLAASDDQDLGSAFNTVGTSTKVTLEEGNEITIDIVSVPSSPPEEMYISIYYVPVAWRYQE